METPESNRASLIPGEWVSSIDLLDAYLHIPIHPNSRKYLKFYHRSQVFQFTSLLFWLATASWVFTMIVKEVKLMALTRGIRLHQYLNDWLIRAQSQEEAHSDIGGPFSVLLVNNKSEVRTKTHSSVFLCGLRIPSRFSPCKTHSRQMAQLQDLILQLKPKHVLTARCLMSLIGLLTSTEKMVPEGRLHTRPFSFTSRSTGDFLSNYIPRRKSGIYWIQVRRAAAAAVEISLWTR